MGFIDRIARRESGFKYHCFHISEFIIWQSKDYFMADELLPAACELQHSAVCHTNFP